MPNKAHIVRSSNSRRSLLAFAALFAVAMLVAGPPANATTYRYTQLDVPGAIETSANGINDTGQIVGSFSNGSGSHGFVDAGGKFTQIDVPGGFGATAAQAINDGGQIAGTFGSHGFLYSGGKFTQLDVPGASWTLPEDINDSGQIVGVFATENKPTHGFLYSGGKFTQLDVPGADWTQAHGINNAGQIVGNYMVTAQGFGSDHGFFYIGGTFTQFDVPGETSTWPTDINDLGQIVGGVNGSPPAKQPGFVDSGGEFTEINVRNSWATRPQGLNDSGTIVGLFESPVRNHGFLATPDGSVVGDPWFTTFDRRRYEFQEPGEYVLSRSTRDGDPFEVQIRSRPWRAGAHNSIVSAVAFELCDHRASFDIDRTGPGDGLIQVDGLSSALSVGAPLLLGGCKILQLSANQYEAVWDTGELVDITDRGPNLNVSSWYSPFLGPNSVEGLLTSPDNPDQWRISDPVSLFDDPPAALDAAAPAAVPEPATLTLLAIALIGFGIIRRRATMFLMIGLCRYNPK